MTEKNSYQSMMEGFKASESLKAKVMQEVEGQKHRKPTQVSSKRTVASETLLRRKKSKAWSIAARAVAIFALLALLVSTEIFTQSDNESHSFALVAYAEVGSPGSSIELQTGKSTIKPAGTGGEDFRFLMNLTCSGEGIESLTYTIEGSDVHFGLIDTTQVNYGEAGSTAYAIPEEFVVDYRNQNEEGVYREIGVNVVDPELKALREEEQALWNQWRSSDDPAEKALIEEECHRNIKKQNAYVMSSIENAGGSPEAYFTHQASEAARKLGDATLRITARYSNGNTETKSYKISPIENFSQVFSNYIEREQTTEFDENDPVRKAPMFTLSEVA